MSVSPVLALGQDQQWIILALAAATVLYLVMRPILKKKKDPLEKMPSIGLAQQRHVEREMSNLLVELSEMARQITAQLDTRSAKLQALIDDADQRIAELKRIKIAPPAEAPALGTEARPAEPSPLPAEDPRYTEIYALADQGQGPREIAQHLQRHQGEVELILALRRR